MQSGQIAQFRWYGAAQVVVGQVDFCNAPRVDSDGNALPFVNYGSVNSRVAKVPTGIVRPIFPVGAVVECLQGGVVVGVDGDGGGFGIVVFDGDDAFGVGEGGAGGVAEVDEEAKLPVT